MSRTILLAGKNGSECEDFADGLLLSSRQVALTGKNTISESGAKKTQAERKAEVLAFDEEKTQQAETGVCTFEWNKSSSLSSRSIVLETENYFGGIDEAVLYFDEEYFASKSGTIDAEEISRSADELILGYQYLASEVLSRYERKYEDKPRTLVFLIKECPSLSDAVISPALKNGKNQIASPIVAAAASAFTSFAENIAALYADENFVNVILVRGDINNEESKREEKLAKWLCSYIDSLEDEKQRLSAKKSVQWIKPGAKKSSGFNMGFNLFKK